MQSLPSDGKGEGMIVLPDQLFAQAVVGPSYSPAVKLMLASMLIQMAYLAWQSRPAWPGVTWEVWLMLAACAVPVVAWSWSMFFGRTTIDARGLRRDVPFKLSGYDLRWHEIAGVRFLDWPIGARLVVKTQSPGPGRAFHAGNARMREAFKRLESLYRPPDRG